MSNATVPVWDDQKQTWNYNGHVVYMFSETEMIDPATGYIFQAPLLPSQPAQPGKDVDLIPKVDPATFQVLTPYTFKVVGPDYNPIDTPLIKERIQNPKYYPTDDTVAATLAVVQTWIANNGGKAYEGVTVSAADDEFNRSQFSFSNSTTGVSVNGQFSVGSTAFNLEYSGLAKTMADLTAELRTAGVLN